MDEKAANLKEKKEKKTLTGTRTNWFTSTLELSSESSFKKPQSFPIENHIEFQLKAKRNICVTPVACYLYRRALLWLQVFVNKESG